MKKILLVAGFMILFVLAIPTVVFAESPTNKVTAGGWFVSENHPFVNYEQIGDECYFGVVGMEQGCEWRGQGSFMDKTLGIKAILDVNSGSVSGGGTLYRLYGVARVSVNNIKMGEYSFELTLEDFEGGQTVQMRIFGLDGYTSPEYRVWAFSPYVGGGMVTAH